jgi:hypothetical protein
MQNLSTGVGVSFMKSKEKTLSMVANVWRGQRDGCLGKMGLLFLETPDGPKSFLLTGCTTGEEIIATEKAIVAEFQPGAGVLGASPL